MTIHHAQDSRIAGLEMAGVKKHKKDIERMLVTRAEHVKALKEQVWFDVLLQEP